MTMKEKVSSADEAAVSEAQIAVHWREEEEIQPPSALVAQANANDPAILERFSEEHSQSASSSTRTCSPGTAGGTRRSMRATLRSGRGSSAGA